MPDLIIKPKNQSGNKLILKSQDDTAVLTTSDSGATLGNSTQDNITRLGTVTVGNLSNSAIVYPAGHIIQVVSNSSAGNANSTSEYITYCTCGITVKKTGSKIFILANPQFYMDDASAMNFVRLKYKTGSLTRTTTVADYADFAANERVMGMDEYIQQLSVINLWTHGQSAGTQIHIVVSSQPSAGSSHNNNSTNGRSEMTLMEVMQ